MKRSGSKLMLVCLMVSIGFGFIYQDAISQEEEIDQIEQVKIVRKRLRNHLNNTRDKFDLSEEERKIERMIMDLDIPKKKVKGKIIRYIRKRYVVSANKQVNNEINSIHPKFRISSETGTHQDMLGLMYLIFRGEPGPLYEFIHLTNHPMSTDFAKSQMTVAGKWKDDKWKAIWFADNLLDFHLDRIVMADHLLYMKSLSHRDHGISVGFNSIEELKRLKTWYGKREKFRDFVFDHPLKSYSRLTWKVERIGLNHSKMDVIEIILDYGRNLIEDQKRRERFFQRFSGRLSQSLSSLLIKQLNK